VKIHGTIDIYVNTLLYSRNTQVDFRQYPWRFPEHRRRPTCSVLSVKIWEKCAIFSDTVCSNLYCILHSLVAEKLLWFLYLLPFLTVRPCTFHSHVICPPVYPSVRPSVMLVDHDRTGWKCWKLIARTISPSSLLFVAQRPSTYSQGNMGKFWGD